MDFRLLGPVEVWAAGHRVPVGHARQRCVLAVLLLDANHVVAADQLVDRVWADRVPRSARETLYSYLSRLRQALGDVDLIRQSGGYLLRIDPMDVDLYRFRHLVAQARAAKDDDFAVTLFDEALRQWQGEPFATLDTPWLNARRRTLEAERHAAELDRTDLLLARHDDARLLPELSTRAAALPLDERVAGQLILALYRAGRTSDALEHYQRLRRSLADELGSDPGQSLQRLHGRILASDPTLIAPTTGVRPRIPRQLPARSAHFVGRTDELHQLTTLLDTADGPADSMTIAAIHGAPGVGKTALAVYWAHQVAEHFGDGQLYVDLRGFSLAGTPMDPVDAIRGFLDAFEIAPGRMPVTEDAQAALYRSLLAERNVLVVLDNAGGTEQVRPLLPGSPSCLVVITSRDQLTGLVAQEGAQPIAVDLPSPDVAADLLTRRIGRVRSRAEPAALSELVSRCARLPLALAIVAARAALNPSFPLRALVDELRDERTRLEALNIGERTMNVRTVFYWSYQRLTIPTARLFRLLGLHPGPDISVAAAASLAGVPAHAARAALAELTRAHLLTEHTPGRFTFHDLLRSYAAQQARSVDPDTERDAALHRVLDFYLHTAHIAAGLLGPHWTPVTPDPPQPGVTPQPLTDRGQALAWCESEHPVLRAAIALAADTGFDAHSWQLPSILRTFFDRQARWYDYTVTLRTALDAARRSENVTAQAETHLGLAYAHAQLHDYDDARIHCLAALGLSVRIDDRAGQAGARRRFGWMLGLQGRYQEALDYTRPALDLYRAAGRRIGEAKVLNDIGWYHARLGDHRQALGYCQRALDLQQELGDRVDQADTQDSLGYIHHHLGDYAEAMTCYRRALALYAEIDDSSSQADTLIRLGETCRATGDIAATGHAWRQALAILEDLHFPESNQIRAKLRELDE